MSDKCSHAPLHFGQQIGDSPSMQVVYIQIEQAARLACPVLIVGESGTGKELVAAVIHRQGSRRYKPFVPVDCSAVSASLFETEMFGCERGAYTGADTNRVGLMQAAGNGTIFLDEIGNLLVNLQVKLLRAIQQREVRPVGSNKWIPVQARLIAATNCDLEEAVAKGTFRQDLFFRLNVIQIRVPPLRTRKQDIPLLVDFFVNKFSREQGKDCSIAPGAIELLASHSWPGNIRELQNVVQRAVALEDGPALEFADFVPETDIHADARSSMWSRDGIETLVAVRRRTILEMLNRTQGKIVPAARALGIGKTTIYRRLREFGHPPVSEKH